MTWFAPLAIVGDRGRKLRYANAAWRALFEDLDHGVLASHVCTAIDHGAAIELDELALGDRTCAVAIYAVGDWAVVSIAPPETAARRSGTPAAAVALRHRFFEVLSHELRSPIATMALWVDVLRDAGTEELRTRATDAIADSCARQTKLVGDLLDLARSIGGRLHIDRRAIAIETVLRETVEGVAAAATAKQIALEHAFDDALGGVTGDAIRLRQVFETFAGNAIERSPIGGRVAISARSVDGVVEIAIRDSGPGATRDQLATMFDPFGSDYSGAIGLRLALAQHLIGLHGGALDASSNELDRGMLLTIKLPRIRRQRD